MKIPNHHGCCVKDGNYHRACLYKNVMQNDCRKKCDQDFGCKGYYDFFGNCRLATSSNCTFHFETNTGDLRKNDSCGNDYEGIGPCFIKCNKCFISFHIKWNILHSFKHCT